MAESDFKTLSDLMPRYDGNPKRLNMYISDVENVLQLFHMEGQSFSNLVVCLIKSRLSGGALDALAYEKSLNTWPDIKQALLRRLGDPRNEIQVMQDLSRTRRQKSEDSEAYGKRLREVLDTLYSVGKNPDKSYYECMVIEQYINQLEFHVSLGVRIDKPNTLEAAIMVARQEEARLAANPPPGMVQNKGKMDFQKHTFPRLNMPAFNSNNFQPQYVQNVQPQSSWTAEQRAPQKPPMLPWHQKPTQGNFKNNNSGTFRNSGAFRQPNMPQRPWNQPQKVSDVTMRSVSKPQVPNFGQQNLFYMAPEETDSNVTQETYYDGEAYSYNNYQTSEVPYDLPSTHETEVSPSQDFPVTNEEDDHS